MALMVQRLGDDAGYARVDDGGRAAGLAYQNVTYEFSHVGKEIESCTDSEGPSKRITLRVRN